MGWKVLKIKINEKLFWEFFKKYILMILKLENLEIWSIWWALLIFRWFFFKLATFSVLKTVKLKN